MQSRSSSSSPFELELHQTVANFLALLLHCNKSSMVQVVPVFSRSRSSSSSPFELELHQTDAIFLALLLHCNKSSMVQVVPVFSHINKWFMV